MTPHESKEAVVEEFRRETILGAALRVVARKGLSGTTMQEIADEAGIAKGTIYLYFDSREDVIEKVVDFAYTQLIERLHSVMTERRPLAERLRGLIREQIAFFDANQQFLRVYMATCQGEADCAGETRRRRARPQYQRYIEGLTRFLQEAMESGEAKRLDASRLALFISEGMASLLLRRLSGSPLPAEDDVEWIADLLLHGMAARRKA